MLKPGERLDDLQLNDKWIIQSKDEFCYGTDAVLLANFAKVKPKETAIDLGTGTGIIPIILSQKTRAKRIIGLELQEHMADMARRSVEYNDLTSRIEIMHMDIKDSPRHLGKGNIDVVVSNPPYVEPPRGIINPVESKAISRFEIAITLEELIKCAYDLLKFKGRLYMIHRADRLVDLVYYTRKIGIEPKNIRFIHPRQGEIPNLILFEGIKGAHKELRYYKPLYIYETDGSYTRELMEIYGEIKT